MGLILITGPARSGKSEWAEQLAARSQHQVTYIATAMVDESDDEWRLRINQHRQRRPIEWKTLEVSLDLAFVIAQAGAEDCLLVDSLGTWLANAIDQSEVEWNRAEQEFLDALHKTESEVILVAEETGWGVVPAYSSGRRFRDRLGRLTRKIGTIADSVYLVTGGYALNLSQLGTPIAQIPSPD
ncbi:MULTISPECIES: bifunctional adenosylcobinamide kinase/adenosylcobinamide-phosphate guanylyltransferase [unclassified Leptolyngbya]|uniref:bifunctional adenosylcobinamide kinase/adenosylcobinamide-phosphate guanylyltransferase n=1 Tax=unclassified Leptolyngbya TaxID=2650499 RepID=UPI001682D93C|nr:MULTISPECIES: bifunctional adenosylcobinamide kinase/adenosylcobinamide-phosphate guanylyltransferase [unclassified Leptolyngbya]MBD1909695.1 bifunctional adenosylcobinamide kinase/adenosylcobinamide-phosphate guanylyltransferase [Leptolyngbya sp. FACHB-8]MBD2155961.1 bifunctional adenosylcobinamide kinase/adenosylcobinamide-phosphate guanylyltransferase [Leptolyngbya sp. FACHB-16]